MTPLTAILLHLTDLLIAGSITVVAYERLVRLVRVELGVAPAKRVYP